MPESLGSEVDFRREVLGRLRSIEEQTVKTNSRVEVVERDVLAINVRWDRVQPMTAVQHDILSSRLAIIERNMIDETRMKELLTIFVNEKDAATWREIRSQVLRLSVAVLLAITLTAIGLGSFL